MRLTFCGVRGSTPAPGAPFLRYGGQTSCVAVAAEGEPVRLLLDAGTGMTRAAELLEGKPFEGSVLLSHLHWDHTHGMPFFAGGFPPGFFSSHSGSDWPRAIRIIATVRNGNANHCLSRITRPRLFNIC